MRDETVTISTLDKAIAGALEEYNAEHPDNPLCEADGTPVSFDY